MYSKNHIFRPKIRQNAFGGQALPGPAGGASALPLAAIGRCLLVRGREGKRKREGREWSGECKEGKGRRRE